MPNDGQKDFEYRSKSRILDYKEPTKFESQFVDTDIPGEIYEMDSKETFIPDPTNPGVWIKKP